MAGPEAILYVSDIDRVAGFYVDGLGLRRVELEEGYCRLEAAGFTLWLVRGDGAAVPTSPPTRRSRVPVKLCFGTQDIDAARPAISDAGGELDTRTWSFGGYLRCDAVDPEGNIVQLLQPA